MNNLKYIDQWTRENTASVHLKLNLATDADIIEWLGEQDSKNGAIKDAIRAAIKKGGE